MKIKQTMYVLDWGSGPDLSSYDPKSSVVDVLGKVDVEVDFDMPSDIEIRDMKVVKLRDKMHQVRADSQIQIERLADEIQRLCALDAPDA